MPSKKSVVWIFLVIFPIAFYSCQPQQKQEQVSRYGQVIRVKPEKIQEYKELHADPWPCVLAKLEECNISNYSIFLRDDLLFAYFEYTGTNFEDDMQKMALDSCTQKWWSYTDSYQEPLETATSDDWWVNMEQVFYME